MDAARWQAIQTLFHAAADLPPDEQRAFLSSRCDDASMVAETLALLAEDARGGSLLDRGVAGVAQQIFDAPSKYSPTADRFGPYRLTRLLGEGGMGMVYLAERDDIGAPAAVKILRDAWLSPARRERFAAEQRTANASVVAAQPPRRTLPAGRADANRRSAPISMPAAK